MSVPEELSLISFDDGDIGEETEPRFSGIRVLSAELGRRGAAGLIEIIEGKSQGPLRISLEPELIVRETCAKAPSHHWRPGKPIEGVHQ